MTSQDNFKIVLKMFCIKLTFFYIIFFALLSLNANGIIPGTPKLCLSNAILKSYFRATAANLSTYPVDKLPKLNFIVCCPTINMTCSLAKPGHF